MCTTGAKVLRPGREFVLFKNRDFTRQHFDDRLSLSDSVFGVLGLETWNGMDSNADRFSGFTIGFNQHLACCDSNVRTVSGGESYDKLVQTVVENCTTIDRAVSYVREQVGKRLFCWGNLVVATADGVAALEIRDHHVEVERKPALIVRTNHHICLGATPNDDDTTTTGNRYQRAHEGLMAVEQPEDIFELLASHQPDRHQSICNHSFDTDPALYNTIYSYVIHWNEGETTFYVHQGHPCEHGDYIGLPINFGQHNDVQAYPTRHPV